MSASHRICIGLVIALCVVCRPAISDSKRTSADEELAGDEREQKGNARPARAQWDGKQPRFGDSGKEAPPRSQTLGKSESGVFVNDVVQNSGFSPSFVMRGFDAGVNLFEGAAHGFNSQDVDLSTIDHVEFYKGPSAMLFGHALGGYGGAANYVRKMPLEKSFAETSITHGSFYTTRFTADIGAPIFDNKNFLFRMTGAAQTSRSFVDFVRSRNFDIAPVFAYLADNGDRWTFRAEYNALRDVFREGFPGDPIFLRQRHSFYAGAPVNESGSNRFAEFMGRYEHAINPDWQFTAIANYYLTATKFGWFLDWGYDGAQSLTLGTPARTENATRSFDGQLRLSGKLDTGSFHHDVFLSLEHWDFYFGHSNRFAQRPLAPINIFHPIYPIGVDYSHALWANGAARAWSNSVYGQDLIDLTPQLKILLGGRYDLLAQQERIFDPLGALSGEFTNSLSKGAQGYISPRAGALYQFSPDLAMFAAYGKSLIPNTGVRLLGGEAPPPQRDTQYEVGVKKTFWDNQMTFEVGLFDVTRDNVAISNPFNPGGFYSLVTGQQHSHGVEANLSGNVTPQLRVSAAATFLHAQVTKDSNTPSQVGSDLLGAPRRTYNFGATYTFNQALLKGLTLGVSYFYASRAQATLPNTYGFTLPPQSILGVTFNYEIGRGLKLEIAANNLLNSANFTSNGALYYGDPRSCTATLTYTY